MEDKEFKYQLGTCLEIIQSGEQGRVIGRAQYLYAEECYLLRYTTRNGEAKEKWWSVSAVT